MRSRRHSVVFQTSFYASLWCMVVCFVISVLLFQAQRNIFEKGPTQETRLTTEASQEALQRLRLSLILASLFITGAVGSIVFVLTRRNLLPIRELAEQMGELAKRSSELTGEKLCGASADDPDETKFFKESLHQYASAFQRATSLEQELRLTRSLSDLAAQVAHDIRSPLAALEMATEQLPGVSEERRILVRGALARIRDIANGLLSGNRPLLRTSGHLQVSADPRRETRAAEVYSLSSLTDSLISEKRMQFGTAKRLSIEGKLRREAYGLFVKVEAEPFKRVLSNLINNAVQAMNGPGRIVVSVEPEAKQSVALTVEDNGRGIPAGVLARVTEKGFSLGKENGSGLGLYYAKTMVEAWGGTLHIESQEGKGTRVSLRLPKAIPPAWFVPQLTVAPGMRIVVVDDDLSVHSIWQERFKNLSPLSPPPEVVHLSMPSELEAWVSANATEPGAVRYLVDHEFVGADKTGLQIICELGLESSAVLVTSRFEERNVIEGCLRSQIRLIPKGEAVHVPLVCETDVNLRPDAILIDDDPLVCAGWDIFARRTGKRLLAFRNSRDFRQVASSLSREIPVFVDSNLGESERGEVLARELHESGFQSIYLVTGYSASAFEPMPWLKGILDKAPPSWLFS